MLVAISLLGVQGEVLELMVSLNRHGRVRNHTAYRSAMIIAAKLCAVQTSVVVDQARRLDSSFFDKEDVEVLKP